MHQLLTIGTALQSAGRPAGGAARSRDPWAADGAVRHGNRPRLISECQLSAMSVQLIGPRSITDAAEMVGDANIPKFIEATAVNSIGFHVFHFLWLLCASLMDSRPRMASIALPKTTQQSSLFSIQQYTSAGGHFLAASISCNIPNNLGASGGLKLTVLASQCRCYQCASPRHFTARSPAYRGGLCEIATESNPKGLVVMIDAPSSTLLLENYLSGQKLICI